MAGRKKRSQRGKIRISTGQDGAYGGYDAGVTTSLATATSGTITTATTTSPA